MHPYEVKERKKLLRSLVDSLSPQKARIIRAYFDLDGRGKRTLKEIGVEFGCTRERIRQLKEEALIELKKIGGERLGRLYREL